MQLNLAMQVWMNSPGRLSGLIPCRISFQMGTSHAKLGLVSGFGCTQEGCTTLGEVGSCYLEMKDGFRHLCVVAKFTRGDGCDKIGVLLFKY